LFFADTAEPLPVQEKILPAGVQCDRVVGPGQPY
jgi:hypothetical protein